MHILAHFSLKKQGKYYTGRGKLSPLHLTPCTARAGLWGSQQMPQPGKGVQPHFSHQYHAYRHSSYLEMLNPSLRASKQGVSVLSCSRELKKHPYLHEVIFFIHFYLLRLAFPRLDASPPLGSPKSSKAPRQQLWGPNTRWRTVHLSRTQLLILQVRPSKVLSPILPSL